MGVQVTRHHLTVPAQSWSLEELRAFCKRSLRSSSIDEQVYRQLILAVDEVAANIVEHAYPKGTRKEMLDIDIDIQDDRVVVEIRDTGVAFNPLTAKPVDPTQSFSAGRKRGYGIPIIRRIIEDIEYERTERGENVLRLTKVLDNGYTRG